MILRIKKKAGVIMKNNKNFSAIKQSIHAVRLLMQFLWKASLGAAILTGGIGIVLLLIPEAYSVFTLQSVFDKEIVEVALGDMLKYSIQPGMITAEAMKPAYVTLIFTTAVTALISAPFLYQIFAFLRAADNGRPFEAENANRLMWMGVLLIINVFAHHIGEYILLLTTIDIVGISNVAADFSLDIGGVVAGVLLTLLAGIFKYGNYLQDEYDATL